MSDSFVRMPENGPARRSLSKTGMVDKKENDKNVKDEKICMCSVSGCSVCNSF